MNELTCCGQIFVSAEDRYEIHCVFCKKAFSKLPDFIKHRKKSYNCNQNQYDAENLRENINLRTEFIPMQTVTNVLKPNKHLNLVDAIDSTFNNSEKNNEFFPKNYLPKTELNEKVSKTHMESNELMNSNYMELDYDFENIEEKIETLEKKRKSHLPEILIETIEENVKLIELSGNNGNIINSNNRIDNIINDQEIDVIDHNIIEIEVSKMNPYKCPKCKNILTTKKGIKKHECPKPKNIICKICGKIFSKSLNYAAHVRTHSDVRPYICHICNYDFKTSSHLIAHRKVHESEKFNECPYCDRKYKHKSSLNKHMKYIHLGVEKPHKCEKCNYRFEEKKDLRYHLEKIHGIKVEYNPPANKKRTHYYELNDPDRIYKCNTCPLSCKTFQNIIEHRKKVHNESFYKCDCCDLTFTKYLEYQRHKFKPFRCSYCRKIIRNEQLKINHNCNKEFVCELCGKKFLRRESLRIHIKTHNEERQYKCKICDLSFKQSSTLYSHSFTHQIGEKVKCRFCLTDFKHNVSLRKHILRLHSGRNKSFLCHLCEMSFYTKYDRSKHQELKHKIPIEKKKKK